MQTLLSTTYYNFQVLIAGISSLKKELGNNFSSLQGGWLARAKIENIANFFVQKRVKEEGKNPWGAIRFMAVNSVQQIKFLVIAAIAKFSTHNITISIYQICVHGASIHYLRINSTETRVVPTFFVCN